MLIQPMANHLYPSLYKTELTHEQLKESSTSSFQTHKTFAATCLHRFSETLWLPGRLNGQLLARSIQPLPGSHKDKYLLGMVIKITSLVLWILTIPLALLSIALAFPIRCVDHFYRPAICYIDNSCHTDAKTKNKLELTSEDPLSIRSHNAGFVTSTMSIAGDLRTPVERAHELVQSIINDPKKPDIICFQETFHEDATKVLCDGISKEYPYIIHNVAPQISGLNSGAMIASKYPIKHVSFERLDHMIFPETAAPRGILRVTVESTKGPLYIYNIHTQSLIGKDRAHSRYLQLEQIKKLMEKDQEENPGIGQVLMGDFNTSHVDAWGGNNLEPKGQAEEKTYNRLQEYFEDLFLKDHDPLTGKRTEGVSEYIETDNKRMNTNHSEPTASWYHGPFANRGLLLKIKMLFDCWINGIPSPQKVSEIAIPEDIKWGTERWYQEQLAHTARFDYILLLKNQKGMELEGKAEIRRVVAPQGAHSGFDHLQVDAIIKLKEKILQPEVEPLPQLA